MNSQLDTAPVPLLSATPAGLRCQRIEDTAGLVRFAHHYGRAAGVPVDLPYLQRTRVIGFFDASGALVGGYVINDRPPFRYLAAVDISAEDLLGADRLPHFRECTCIWMDRRLRLVDRMRVYLKCVRDMSRGDRKYVLGGSCHAAVAAVQRQGMPHVLYEGEVTVGGATVQASIYYGTRVTLWAGFFKGLVRRLVRRRRRRA